MPKPYMQLIRSPRSQTRKTDAVRREVAAAYRDLGERIAARAHQDVANWSVQPEFKVHVKVTKSRYLLEIKYDKRTEGGKRYYWIDQGTGQYAKSGKGSAYLITPKNPDGVLKYDLPTPMPKSNAADGSLAPSYTAPPGTVTTKGVMHPGIKPRLFMDAFMADIKSRKPGSFHNVTEAAIKRGLRKS